MGKGRNRGLDLVPRHHRNDHQDRQHVEHQDPERDRDRQVGDRLGPFLGFGGGKGGDLGATHRENRGDHPGDNRADPGRGEPAMGGEVGEGRSGGRSEAERECCGNGYEGNDRHHLGRGEPEFELAIGFGRHQVDGRQQRHQHHSDLPDLELRQPQLDDDLRAGNRLHRDHHRPEIPVEPADHEPGPVADPLAGEIGEGLDPRHRDRHFRDHPHHQHDEDPGQPIGNHRRRADRADRGGGSDEQPGTDDPAESDHRDVPRLERAAELLGRTIFRHWPLDGGHSAPDFRSIRLLLVPLCKPVRKPRGALIHIIRMRHEGRGRMLGQWRRRTLTDIGAPRGKRSRGQGRHKR